MKIKTFRGGYDNNFAYLIEYQDRALLIDPSYPAKEILAYCEDNRLKLIGVVVMHSHHDHIVDLQTYKHRAITIYAHSSSKVYKDEAITEDDVITLGNMNFNVMHTPGHRFDSICLLYKKHLFTSDTLFVHGCGRVDFEGSNPNLMLDTLERIKRMPEDTTLYPGHDYGPTKTSTIEIEKRMNPFLKMTREEFLKQRLG